MTLIRSKQQKQKRTNRLDYFSGLVSTTSICWTQTKEEANQVPNYDLNHMKTLDSLLSFWLSQEVKPHSNSLCQSHSSFNHTDTRESV